MTALLTARAAGNASITMDWLSFTFTEDTHEAAAWISLFAGAENAVDCAPSNGYRAAYCTPKNVLHMWNLDRPEMGHHVVISGSAIRNIVGSGDVDQQALLASVIDAGGKITRLDLAKDIEGEDISLDKIYQAVERGDALGSSRTFSQIHSMNGGNTIYVGSPQSQKLIRIYDKASQMHLSNCLWFRLELETKGMVARSVASALVQSRNWNAVWQEVVQHMVNLPGNVDWNKFFVATEVEIGIPKLEKKSDREKWIEKQVIPAVVKHYVENRKSGAIALLRAMLDNLDKPEYSHDNEL